MPRIRYHGVVDGLTFHDVLYDCLLCSDSGWVTIVAPISIRAAIAHPELLEDRYQLRRAYVACTCEHSERQAQNFQNGRPIAAFGEEPWHIRYWDDDVLAKCATYEHRPAGYYEEFAGMES